MPGWLEFLIGGLAVWRVTHLLAEEDGPAAVVARFRSWLGDGFLGSLFDCFACVSIWTGAAVALLLATTVRGWVISWLALSGMACLVERVTASKGERS